MTLKLHWLRHANRQPPLPPRRRRLFHSRVDSAERSRRARQCRPCMVLLLASRLAPEHKIQRQDAKAPRIVTCQSVSVFCDWSFHRTLRPAFMARFAMCAVRAASWATRMLAVGDLRLRMQSSQFCRCARVPSDTDVTRISGSGVLVPGTFLLSSLYTTSRSRSIFSVALSPLNSSPPSSMRLTYVPMWVTMKSFGNSRVEVTVSGSSQILML